MPSKFSDLIFFNSAFIGLTIAKYQEAIDWYLTTVGSGLLVAFNAVRLWQLLRYPQSKSEKRKP
jgi:hypothetical protein